MEPFRESDRDDDAPDSLDAILARARRHLGELRDTIVRSGQVGRKRVDLTLLKRERDRLFRKLGEQVYRLIEDGRLPKAKWLRKTYNALHELSERITREELDVREILEQLGEQPEQEDADERVGDDEVVEATFGEALPEDPDEPTDEPPPADPQAESDDAEGNDTGSDDAEPSEQAGEKATQ